MDRKASEYRHFHPWLTSATDTRQFQGTEGACDRRRHPRTDDRMENHNAYICPGCDRVLHLEELAVWLDESVATLYKWSSRGYPAFPRRTCRHARRVAVTCRSVKSWLTEEAR
jgi:predicted DNA-binding transcriptional regulator AlpA